MTSIENIKETLRVYNPGPLFGALSYIQYIHDFTGTSLAPIPIFSLVFGAYILSNWIEHSLECVVIGKAVDHAGAGRLINSVREA